jgi:hypothetical protein
MGITTECRAIEGVARPIVATLPVTSTSMPVSAKS